MALIYDAQLTPTKSELLFDWLPRQPWCPDRDGFTLLGSFRFDDPADDVGIETHLVGAASGNVYQVPLTYRGAPLADGDAALITQMQHSVLGERWVYDATADPVYAEALVAAIALGEEQAEVFVDGEAIPQPPSVQVRGTGELDLAPGVVLLASETDGLVTKLHVTGANVLVARVVGEITSAQLRLDAVAGVPGAPRTLAELAQ